MKNIFSKIIAFSSLILFVGNANAQCGAVDCFVKGDFVEVGISKSGAFGACTAPSGYHPGGGRTALGFVSDPDKDGWLVSSPGSAAYMGDYFVPGHPYEGWDVQYAAIGRQSANNCLLGASFGSSTSFGNVSYTATATEQRSVWEGTVGDLFVRQTTVVKKDKLYFVMFVDLVNTGASTLNNVYYHRAVDPDNEVDWGGSYVTVNRIVFQPNFISKNCLVTATGQMYPSQSYLGLGTKDCRAKCYILNSGLSSSAALDNIYNQSGAAASFLYNVSATNTNDVGYGLVFNLGNLTAGQKTSLAYTYILKQADLDSALGETAPKFESGGAPYSPYTTFRVCPGKTVPLRIVNGGQYKWIWTTTASPNYMAAPGTSTLIPDGGTIPTITGTKVYPFGAVSGDSCVVTVFGPRTYTATGISTCDTQYLIFYVDTINFSVAPSVTSPVRYCEGETPTALTAGLAAGATANWYTVGTGGTALPGGAPTPSTTFPAGAPTDFDTTNYWVSQTNAAGCETPRARIQVIVTKKPAPPVTKNLIYCLGDTTKMLTAVGNNLKWYDAATAGTRYASTPTPTSTKAGTTSYFVSQTNNGCESDRAQLDVEISQAIAVFTKSKDSLCGTELLTLTNTSTTSSTGSYISNWAFGDGLSSTDSNTTHSYQDARGTYTIKLLVTNVNGCKDSTKQIVEVFKEPVMGMTASDTMICQGGAVDFQGIATPGYSSLTWDFGDGDPAYNVLAVRHAFTKAGIFPIKINGTYPACPGTGSGITVNVVPIPNVNLGNDTGFCPGNTVLTLRNINTTAVEKYIWNTGDTSATIQVRNAGQYSVTAQNWQCRASDSITISKACYLDIPNGFNPGSGSDYDSYFLPRDLLSKSVVTFEMEIYDRWGQQLFMSDKLNGRGWDGTYKGQPMPFGVYVYIIRVSFANGVTENYNGNVTLIR